LILDVAPPGSPVEVRQRVARASAPPPDLHEPAPDPDRREASVAQANGRPAGPRDDLEADIADRVAAFLRKWPGPGERRSPAREAESGTSVDGAPGAAREPEEREPKEREPKEREPVEVEPADLTIVVISADRREPSVEGARNTAAGLLAISPGTATVAELSRLAVAADESGRRIDGIVVADPDPWDSTAGRHSLDERARRARLPLRLTGTATVRGERSVRVP
jgi:hypothetical protein